MATVASAAGLALLPRWSAADDEVRNSGPLEHLLLTASHDRIAIKATFTEALEGPVFLNAGTRQVSGNSTDSDGRFFAFDIGDLEADVEYTLQFEDAGGGTPPQTAIGLTHATHGEVQEKNGFTLLDVTPEEVTIRLFAWKSGEPLEAIDALEPYHTFAIKRT